MNHAKYKKVCLEIFEERELKCTGCGRYQTGDIKLSHSHIISQKHCKEMGREDLVYNKYNITYHCMAFGEHEGCHGKWEGSRRIELNDYDVNMTYIRSIDEQMYQRMLVE